MTELRIPTPLRQYTDGAKQIEVQSDTVGQAVEHLAQTYPALKKHLFTEEGELRTFVNLFLNNEDIRFLHHIEPVGFHHELTFIGAVRGPGHDHGVIDEKAWIFLGICRAVKTSRIV